MKKYCAKLFLLHYNCISANVATTKAYGFKHSLEKWPSTISPISFITLAYNSFHLSFLLIWIGPFVKLERCRGFHDVYFAVVNEDVWWFVCCELLTYIIFFFGITKFGLSKDWTINNIITCLLHKLPDFLLGKFKYV